VDKGAIIRRQEHGIRAVTLSMTLPAAQRARLRREAAERGITVSRHISELLRLAWSVQGALGHLPAAANPDTAGEEAEEEQERVA
jgi:hypothetical protein